jgi:hypothetical protein
MGLMTIAVANTVVAAARRRELTEKAIVLIPRNLKCLNITARRG